MSVRQVLQLPLSLIERWGRQGVLQGGWTVQGGRDKDEEFSLKPHYYTKYVVDGFRSLKGFEIKLEEGLNVLVGPNGAGKTNFIDLLDFLSVFLTRGLAAATSNSGGIARVFSQESLKSRIPRVQIHVSGLADLENFVGADAGLTLFRYDYDLDIRYSRTHSALYVASEKIKLKSLFWKHYAVHVNNTVGTLEIRRRTPSEEIEPEVEIGSRLKSRGVKNPFRYRSRLRSLSRPTSMDGGEIELPVTGPDQSILGARTMLPALDAIRESLSRGRTFNLTPSLAREPSDITTAPVIMPDGSGLSATLYHLDQARRGRITVRAAARRFSSEDLDTIIEWTRLVLPELSDITTAADPHTGKYISTILVSFGDSTLRVPLQGLSDGTLKWLSFVCLIISAGAARSIEEPENFLHPKMQKMMISLIRDSMISDHPGHFILSTHSESIINQCSPKEIILFQFKGGETKAGRLSKPEKVEEQINETGFGLGYYYASNALS